LNQPDTFLQRNGITTELHLAAIRGDISESGNLVKNNKTLLNARDEEGDTPLQVFTFTHM
jgi:ankyrin repeat protein